MAWAKTYTFSASTTILSAEVNTNFDDCINAVNAAMPSGLIAIWSGAVAAIPSGFYLCNGSNSTPDLRGQFVIGAGGSYNPADTGGEATHTLTGAESGTSAHSHAITDPTHQHSMPGEGDAGAGTMVCGANEYVRLEYTNYSATGITINNSTAANASSAHNNLPPYYALAYIMKS